MQWLLMEANFLCIYNRLQLEILELSYKNKRSNRQLVVFFEVNWDEWDRSTLYTY